MDDFFKEMNVAGGYFLFLLSDAASYILKATKTLKAIYPLLVHLSCTAHLLHNYAEHIRTHFKDTYILIASIKAEAVKNKDRCIVFTATVCQQLHNQF